MDATIVSAGRAHLTRGRTAYGGRPENRLQFHHGFTRSQAVSSALIMHADASCIGNNVLSSTSGCTRDVEPRSSVDDCGLRTTNGACNFDRAPESGKPLGTHSVAAGDDLRLNHFVQALSELAPAAERRRPKRDSRRLGAPLAATGAP